MASGHMSEHTIAQQQREFTHDVKPDTRMTRSDKWQMPQVLSCIVSYLYFAKVWLSVFANMYAAAGVYELHHIYR